MNTMIELGRKIGDRMLTAFVPQLEAKADACPPYCWCDSDGQGGDWCCEDPCRGDIWCTKGC